MIITSAKPQAPSADARWKLIEATMRRHGNQSDALIETLHTADAEIEKIRVKHDYTIERVTGRHIDYAVPSRGLIAGSIRDLKRFYDQLVPKD